MTRNLLMCGLFAGPVFTVVLGLQIATREGFDAVRHPISVLSLGEHGWVQVGNFVVTGALSIAFSVGVWRGLHPGPAGSWGPILIGGYGFGLLIAGLFLGDPGLGFPPGTPDSIGSPSWHGLVHAVGPPLAFVSLIAACCVFARRFVLLHRTGWAGYCLITAIVAAVCSLPGPVSTIRVLLAVLVTSVWTTALAVTLLAELTGPGPAG